jgi:hypothetical protein
VAAAPSSAPIVLQYPQSPQVAPDARAGLPIRARRRLALLGEVGWNGIAGFGPNLVFHVDPHFSFDLGAGLSLLGCDSRAFDIAFRSSVVITVAVGYSFR